MRFRFALIAILLVLLACAHSADRKQEPPISIGTELVTHGKIKIAYRTFGEGPTLVVINGGPGRASFHFTDLARRLSSYGFRVVLFDQRGTGDSKLTEVNEDTITLNAMVDDLEEVRTSLGIADMFLLGHSFGGTYAMAYITKYPQRVKKLVLSASGAADLKTMESAMQHMRTLLRPAQAKIYAKWTSRETKQSDPVKARIESLRVTAPLYVVKAEFVAEVEKKLTDLAHYNPVVNDLVWRSMKRQAFDVRSALGSLKTPALILDGDRDFLGPAVPTSLKDSIPNSRLYILKNCSHYPWLDAPEEYFKLIRDFLT